MQRLFCKCELAVFEERYRRWEKGWGLRTRVLVVKHPESTVYTIHDTSTIHKNNRTARFQVLAVHAIKLDT